MSALASVLSWLYKPYSDKKYEGVSIEEIPVAEVHKLWTFYMLNDTCSRCRRLLNGIIAEELELSATWDGTALTQAYKDLLKMALVRFFDAMMAVGLVPWKRVVVADREGKPQSVPYVVCPTEGTFHTLWKDGVLVDVLFEMQHPGGRSERCRVAYLGVFAPEPNSALRSLISGVIMRMYLCSCVQNSEVQAMAVAARPPLVLEQANDSLLGTSAIDDYVDNGGLSSGRAQHDSAAVAAQQRLRALAGQQMQAAAGGSRTATSGSTQYVPDTFTGAWPPAQRAGPYNLNEHYLKPGIRLTRQELPHVLSDSSKWVQAAEHVICNMFGVSITLLYPDNASSKFRASVSEAVVVTRYLSMGNVRWAAQMLEDVLNEMFYVTDSARIAVAAVSAARQSGGRSKKRTGALGGGSDAGDADADRALSSGHGDGDGQLATVSATEKAAKLIAKKNRYKISVSYGHTASGEDLAVLYRAGIITLADYKELVSVHYTLDKRYLRGDGVPVATAAPAQDQSAKREMSDAGRGSSGGPPPKKPKATEDLHAGSDKL